MPSDSHRKWKSAGSKLSTISSKLKFCIVAWSTQQLEKCSNPFVTRPLWKSSIGGSKVVHRTLRFWKFCEWKPISFMSHKNLRHQQNSFWKNPENRNIRISLNLEAVLGVTPLSLFPADIYLWELTMETPEQSVEICLKLTITTPERRQWRRPDIFIINFEHISIVFLLLPLIRYMMKSITGTK